MGTRLKMPIEKLRAAFRYDPETGDLINRYSRPPAMAGEVAGSPNGSGYVNVGFEGVLYAAHRVVWALNHDTVPDEIDHWDTDRKNNRIGNLRDCTRRQNMQNQTVRRAGRALPKGVTVKLDRGILRIRARITVAGKQVFLGYFKTEEEAAAAYQTAANARFGAFARTS